MKDKLFIAGCLVLFLALASIAVFGLSQRQLKISDQIFSFWKKSTTNTGTSTEEEIAALRREIEELRKQPPQIIYKTVLTPASPSPLPDLKTKEDLQKAKEQINSLEQQLAQLQTKTQQAAPGVSEADLIKSWRASEKVAQIACENKFLGSWQLGSGVLISADGKVLTNQHVVEPSLGLILPDFCLLMFSSDFDVKTQKYTKEYRATIVGFFQNRDAALLKIKDMIYKDQNGAIQSAPISGSFQYFQSATSSPQIGDAVYIIGYPESAKFAYSVTKGIISNLTSDGVYFGTDAQIDRGNSGGAAINSNGQLVGLPTYKYAGGGDYRGYILDINSLKL